MLEVILVRHGQASFGTANYDVLSDRGHRQARALGEALRRIGVAPAALVCGGQRRHRETLEGVAAGLGISDERVEAPGLNEFAFGDLLAAHLQDHALIAELKKDARAYFRQMKETVLAWQNDEIAGPPERFSAFQSRVSDAFSELCAQREGPVVAVSSGGPIALTTATVLGAHHREMINLQMQLRNCGIARFIARDGAVQLASFNEAPHIHAENRADMLTYH